MLSKPVIWHLQFCSNKLCTAVWMENVIDCMSAFLTRESFFVTALRKMWCRVILWIVPTFRRTCHFHRILTCKVEVQIVGFFFMEHFLFPRLHFEYINLGCATLLSKFHSFLSLFGDSYQIPHKAQSKLVAIAKFNIKVSLTVKHPLTCSFTIVRKILVVFKKHFYVF
jgi:hypothetical protein